MTLKTVSKWIVIAAALIVSVQVPSVQEANATVACRCGAATAEYQILEGEDGPVVRVWVVNTCRNTGFVQVTVVARAEADDAQLLEREYVYLPKYSRRPVDIPFDQPLKNVVYWYATRLAGGYN